MFNIPFKRNRPLFFYLLVTGLAVAIVITLLLKLYGHQAIKKHNEQVVTEAGQFEVGGEVTAINEMDFILLEIPIMKYADGNFLSTPIVLGYRQQIIQKNDEFIIDPATLGYEMSHSVGAMKLKLVDILSSSIIVDVLADIRFDGNFYPRNQTERHNITDGKCIGSFPLVVDAYYEYCFEVGVRDSRILLKFNIEGRSTMPSPFP
jgi:hypothetical protein